MKNRQTEKQLQAEKNYVEFIKEATEVVNKYEAKGDYGISHKVVCLYVIDLQIAELKKVNSKYVTYATSSRGLHVAANPTAFYDNYIKPAYAYRETLQKEIADADAAIKKELEELRAEVALTHGQRILRDVKAKVNGIIKKEKV